MGLRALINQDRSKAKQREKLKQAAEIGGNLHNACAASGPAPCDARSSAPGAELILQCSADRSLKAVGGVFEVFPMLTQVLESVRAYFRDQENVADLRDLSDAALNDIGLLRTDLTTMRPKAEPARQRPLTLGSPFADWPAATAHAA